MPQYNARVVDEVVQPFTDEYIEAAIAEIAELRKMYEALKTIDEEADFDAKRALIDILNLRVTLYVKENGERWVDIHWLRKVYPKVAHLFSVTADQLLKDELELDEENGA